MLNKYDLTVGLEVHVELKTMSKIFCSCKNEFSNEPNTNCCEICLGMPGALPFLNKEAVNKAISIGKILNCNINNESWFDRKHFKYMDLVKNYQITQYEKPIGVEGSFPIVLGDKTKNIQIEKIHLEEDAGKVVYKDNKALIDYNRSGVPLVEIVTKPVFKSVEEVLLFLEQLKAVLKYNDISDCKMNEGSYRFDVNISVKEKNETVLGNRTEIKNMNSFREVAKAINAEFLRQIKILESGKKVLQQSLNWNDKEEQIVVLRTKENVSNYKFLRDYNLPKMKIEDKVVNDIVINKLTNKIVQYVNNYELSYKETLEILKNKNVSNIYENTINYFLVDDYKLIRNLFIEILLKENVISKTNMNTEDVIVIINYLKQNKINNTILKKAIQKSIKEEVSPVNIINSQKLFLINDEDEIVKLVKCVLLENENLVRQYKDGKTKVLKSIVGKVMAKGNGLVNPMCLNEIIEKQLKM